MSKFSAWILCILLLAVLVGGALWWFGAPGKDGLDSEDGTVSPRSRSANDQLVPRLRFVDVTNQAGIRFKHTAGGFGKKLLPETMGSGVAVLDFDQDGKQDLLFVNSCYWPGFEPRNQSPPTLALYRNKGDGTFEEVTAACGLKLSFYGMGVTVGDYDNDGFPDLFITGVGGNHLFHNEPVDARDATKGRRFIEVTATAGVAGPEGWPRNPIGFLDIRDPISFCSSATFVDYDGDGLLDLFVCTYVSWSPAKDLDRNPSLMGVDRVFNAPSYFDGTYCILYRNLGGGRFQDVSAEAGIRVSDLMDGRDRPAAKALGVIACDVDEDGWPDLVVANDTARNFFFHNVPDGKGGRRFVEKGREVGVAYNADGRANGAMGVDYGVYRPGHPALLIGNFAAEPDTFLRLENPRRLIFADASVVEGVAGPSQIWLKFGVFFFDYDLDGRLDFLTCNGHLEKDISLVQPGQAHAQPAQLFWNNGGKSNRFTEVKEKRAGPDLFRPMVGRSCAFLDLDGDGYLDVVLTENDGPARLLRNQGELGNHWIRLVLEGDGKRSNRSAIGARVIIEAAGQEQRRQVTAGRGYLSQSELPLTFGLGSATKIDKMTIYWPGKDVGKQEFSREELARLVVDRTHTVTQRLEK